MGAYAYRLPRKYRYRARGGKLTRNQVIGIAVVIVVAAAMTGGKGIPRAGRAGNISGGTSLGTRTGWAHALLAADDLPLTTCNLSAVTAWEVREGGSFGNQAAYNPLNVNPPAGVGWPGHPAIGAWAFPDAVTGLRYTVATLDNGYYGGVLAALRAGDSAQAVCDAVMASPWASSHYYGTLTAAC